MENQAKKSKTIIYRALLKYGYSQFSLEILEYCESENCIAREQYYLNLLPHDYNILPNAGSLLGFKHSEETRAKQSAAHKGEKNPMFRKARPIGAGSPSQRIEVQDLLTN